MTTNTTNVDWSQLVKIADNPNLAMNTITGTTLTSSFETSVSVPKSIAFTSKLRQFGINYSEDVLKNLSAIVYDDSATYLPSPQHDLVQKITDQATKDFYTAFFPADAKYRYKSKDPEIETKTAKNITPIDIDNIMPVSPQGYTFMNTGNVHITASTKNYTKAYLSVFDMLVSKLPLMPTLMDTVTYFVPNGSNYDDKENENNERQVQLENIQSNVKEYLKRENTLQDLNIIFAKSVGENIKRSVAVKSFTRRHIPRNEQTQSDNEYWFGASGRVVDNTQKRVNIFNLTDVPENTNDSNNSTTTMYNYINNAMSFMHKHTIYSSQQRALFFEKDFGIRPFFYVGNINDVVNNYNNNFEKSMAKNVYGNLIEHIEEDTSLLTTEQEKEHIPVAVTLLSKLGERKDSIVKSSNRFWSSFVGDCFVDSQGLVDTQNPVNGSFLHMFQHRIAKVYGYCKGLSVSDYSLIFDSTKDNAAVLEQYISDFYQFAMACSKSTENVQVGVTKNIKIVVILQPSVVLSELSQYVLFYLYKRLYDNILTTMGADTAKEITFKLFGTKFLHNDLSTFEKMVVHCKNLSDMTATTFLPIDRMDLSGEDTSFVKLFKQISGEFSSTHLEHNTQFLKFANKQSLHTWLADQKDKTSQENFWLYYWLYIMSSILTQNIHGIMNQKFQEMAVIPNCGIELTTVSYPVHVNPIRTPVSSKVARFFNSQDENLLSGYESCQLINAILDEKDSDVAEQLRNLLSNSKLQSERNIPSLVKNPNLNLAHLLVHRLEDNKQFDNTNTTASFREDPRTHIKKTITFQFTPNVFVKSSKEIQDIVYFTDKQHNDGSLQTLTNLQSLLKDDIQDMLDLETNDVNRLKATIRTISTVKNLSDVFIAKLSEIAELMLRVTNEEDILEMRQLKQVEKDTNTNDMTITQISFTSNLEKIMIEANLIKGQTKNGILITEELEKTMRELLELDNLLRLNETRILIGKRLCKIINIWKTAITDITTISRIWHTFMNKKVSKVEVGGIESGTPIGIHKASTMREYIKSQNYSVADRKFSLLSDVMESFEDPLSNGDSIITETPDKLNASNTFLNGEKLSQRLEEIDNYIQEQNSIREKSLKNKLVTYATWFASPVTSLFSKITTPKPQSVPETTDDDESTTAGESTTPTSSSTSSTSTTKSPTNVRRIHYDDVDWLIDNVTVCSFFKNCTLLDHGYMANEHVLYGLCKNEGSAMNYFISFMDEFRSGNASSTIISPFKGYLDKFYEEFRDSQNTPNNPFFNPRILLGRIRVDVDPNLFVGKTVHNTGTVLNTVSKDIILEGTPIKLNTKVATTSLLQVVDFKNQGPEISFPGNIISVTENRIVTALKWIKILGSISTSMHITARLLDINKTYSSPYSAPLCRRIGTGLPQFIVQPVGNDFQHPAYISSLIDFVWGLVNDGVILLPTKYSIYMNPHHSFSNKSSNESVKGATLFDQVNKSNELTNKNVTGEKDALELLGEVLLCRSTLSPNIIWIDPNALVDVTKNRDSENEFIEWATGMFNDVNRALGFKLWSTVNYRTFSDLVPVNPLCAIKANKLYCRTPNNANYIPAKKHVFKREVLEMFSNENPTLKNLCDTDKFVISTYDEDALIQRPLLTQKEFTKSSLSITSSFLSERSKEFNLRRTYFDLACTNISSVLKFGALRRPLINKRIWNNVVSRSPSFGSDSLAHAIDSHIRSFFYNFQKEAIAEPQLYLVHSRKMISAANLRRYNTSSNQESMLMSSFYGQTLHTFNKKNVVDTLVMEYKPVSDGGNGWNNDNKIATNYVTKEAVDLRWLIDASFSRQMRHHLENINDTTQRIDDQSVRVPTSYSYAKIFPSSVTETNKSFVAKKFSAGKTTANVPSNSWNSDSFPVIYQTVTSGSFYYDLIGMQCQRKVGIPIYSLDSSDYATMIVAPYFSSDDVLNGNVKLEKTQELDSHDKFNTIYKDLSWIADTGKQDNTGLAIVAMMAYVASLWLVCMTAKIESLEIYKPQDILKMSVGKWIIPHAISDDSNTVSGISAVNKNIYDLYEKEFTGISDVVIAELSNGYSSSSNSSETTSKILKTTTPTLSEEGRQRLRQAFQYISMLPDMYRRHTGHSFHLYEKQAILNSGDPITARENQLRNIDLVNTSHAFLEDPNTNTISQNMFMFGLLANDKVKDTLELAKNEEEYIFDNDIVCQPSLIHRYAHLAQKTRIAMDDSNTTDLIVKQHHALSSQVQGDLQVNDTEAKDLLNEKNTLKKSDENPNDIFIDDDFIHKPESSSSKFVYAEDTDDVKIHAQLDRQLEIEFTKAHRTYAQQKKNDDTDSILNSNITEGFSVTSILYSLLVNNERIVEQQVLSPLKRDSFNIIYTLTKMMESAGTQPTRLLDSGAGFSNLLLSGTQTSNEIKDLLDASISMNSVDLWSTFSSSAFELGGLDSLISDE